MTAYEYYYEATSKSLDEISRKVVCNDIYVLYSGGCDSTLALYETLLLKKTEGLDVSINTISFKSPQLASSKYEEINRNKFFDFLKEQDLHVDKKLMINITNEGSNGIQTGQCCCPQPAIWLYNMMAYLPVGATVITGYIHGDDFLTMGVFNDWYNSYIGLNKLFDKNMDIYMPYAYVNKDEIINRLKNLKIDQYTSYCEHLDETNGKPCGRCESCKKHKAYSSLIEKPKIIRRLVNKKISCYGEPGKNIPIWNECKSVKIELANKYEKSNAKY